MSTRQPTLQKSVRRKRDPEATRIAILEAAKTVLAKDGAEGLSVSSVAKLAGVNRGTAYQHFQIKDDLVRATLDWVSEQLLEAVFGDLPADGIEPVRQVKPDRKHLSEVMQSMVAFNLRLAEYTIENPEIARIWLYDVLSRKNPKEDVFFKQFETALIEMAESDATVDNIDAEPQAVLMLAGYFLWPVWVRSHAKTKKERKQMARRFVGEAMRSSMHGVFRADSKQVDEFLKKSLAVS